MSAAAACEGPVVTSLSLSNSPSPCANPGHYITLVTLRIAKEMRPAPPPPTRAERHGTGTVRVTRAYRLINVDEVTRALQAKKEKSRRAARSIT
uniref:Uncharacterized protein n=1 Tax=Oryza nivara TaxID=4536 RepID=A0A0E0I4R8_ORYNI